MGFFSYDPEDRWALLVCDACDRVLVPKGCMTQKTLADSFPEETAPYFRWRDELRAMAKRACWSATKEHGTDRVLWTCPECKPNARTGD